MSFNRPSCCVKPKWRTPASDAEWFLSGFTQQELLCRQPGNWQHGGKFYCTAHQPDGSNRIVVTETVVQLVLPISGQEVGHERT